LTLLAVDLIFLLYFELQPMPAMFPPAEYLILWLCE